MSEGLRELKVTIRGQVLLMLLDNIILLGIALLRSPKGRKPF